jgi:DNA-binding CsgD family transcriptional regulator
MLGTMYPRGPLIGREDERAVIDREIEAARTGHGGLVLVTGEAGAGKTALVNAALTESGLTLLVGTPAYASAEPYGPIVAVLRAFIRAVPDGLHRCGPLSAHLHILLPELGPPPDKSDPATLVEAIRCGFEQIARVQPAIVFLDDLHSADEATIDLLTAATGWIEQLPLLIVGAYRADELPRDHPLRRLRLELRRVGRAHELTIEPLDLTGTACLAARVLGQTLSPALRAVLHDRTQGLPFFVQELAEALAASGRLRTTPDGLALDPSDPLPIPESVRDAVLLRARDITDAARTSQQVAAVAGLRFQLDLVAELAGGEDGLDELIGRQIVVEVEPGVGGFRHALVREAIYDDVPWGRRRALHRQIAERLEARNAPPRLIAEHWSAAHEPARARRSLIAAAEAFCAIHAYRDAARAADRALALWTDDDTAERLELLERLGHCAELSGDLSAAARAWREAADGWRELGDIHRAATVERRLATVYELQCAWPQALAARLSAADAFASIGMPGDAAAERFAVAHHLRIAASFTAALSLLEVVRAEADAAGRIDLKARAMGHAGNVLARMGQYEAGLALVRDGLSLALEHNLSGPAVEIYQRLGDSLAHAGQYDQARETYQTASDFCRSNGESLRAELCLACMSVVLWQTGEWDQTVQIGRDVLASEGAYSATRMAAAGMLGATYAFRGETARARPLLLQSATIARPVEVVYVELLNEWAFAYAEHVEGNDDAAAGHCRALLARWERTEERHYAISPLRWATTFFAGLGAAAEAGACASALSRIAADTGNVEALAGLAHALGETLLLDGETEQAARQFEHALVLLREIPVPFDVAQTHLRAGVARAAAGQRTAAVEHLTDAYRMARKLGARPLAAQASHELAALGEPPERRPGRRSATESERGGLSQRQIEVLRHIALGRTDREIAQLLYLSPRTVEMHVANCLAKLDCRSRAEAIHRAGDLGVLAG